MHIFQERSRQYWPSCGSECYGKFLVDELRERDDECENVVVRELSVTYTEVGKRFIGKLFTLYLLGISLPFLEKRVELHVYSSMLKSYGCAIYAGTRLAIAQQ